MNEEVKKWEALPNEEKNSVLNSFLRRLDNMNYDEICRTYDLFNESNLGTFGYKHPALILRLADPKMAHQIMAWMYHTENTSQGEIRVPFAGYFIDEITFDKVSLMNYSEEEKAILKQAMEILRGKGVGQTEH